MSLQQIRQGCYMIALGMVNLFNINHKNVSNLNTTIVIIIFAHQRQQLSILLNELCQLINNKKESK